METELFFFPDQDDEFFWIVAKTAEAAKAIAFEPPADESLEGEARWAFLRERNERYKAYGPWVCLCEDEAERMLGFKRSAVQDDPIRVTFQVHL